VADRDLLQAATRIAPLTSSDRLRLARELRGWTQRTLADEMASTGHSITPAALSQLERGNSTPSGRTLLAIADATDFPLDYFVRRDADGDADGFFRSLRSTPVRDRRRAVARAHLLHDFVLAIEDCVELPDLDLPRIELGHRNRESIESAAAAVRRAWGIAPGPVPDVVRELERHGIVTTRLAFENEKLDAFSVWFSDRPVVVLVTNKGNTARSRFDAAHELGHGVIHDADDIGTKEAESEAHQFASAFLMPEAEIRPFLSPSVDWRELMDVKAEWGVSMAALLVRARDLGILSQPRYVSAMKYMSTRGWRREEPGDRLLGRPEVPRIVRTALRELAKDDLGIEDLAFDAGLPAGDVFELVGSMSEGRTRIDL
jgi:Zn-dependent peptidase ImmA (M78 family)/DNA-binding XRE family transcriptional regulator